MDADRVLNVVNPHQNASFLIVKTDSKISYMPTPEQMLSELIKIFPDFEAEWDSDTNYFISDAGVFTHHGLFLEFTHYFFARFDAFSAEDIRVLCSYIEQYVQNEHMADEVVDNAICTCFLEDVGTNPNFDKSKSSRQAERYVNRV